MTVGEISSPDDCTFLQVANSKSRSSRIRLTPGRRWLPLAWWGKALTRPARPSPPSPS